METTPPSLLRRYAGGLVLLATAAVVAAVVWFSAAEDTAVPPGPGARRDPVAEGYRPRRPVDSSGFGVVVNQIPPWPAHATLARVADSWRDVGHRLGGQLDLRPDLRTPDRALLPLLIKASLLNYEGEPEKAYGVLEEARILAESRPDLAAEWLYTVIAYQGVAALRQGETENCVLCRGESSCILPLAPAAVHSRPAGSRRAIRHFTEYLDAFPGDLEIRWLLNLAHATLGEYPDAVPLRHRVPLDRYTATEHGIGKFRDVGDRVGINRLNQAGGVILDDFDNDDRLDLVFTSNDPTQAMVFYRNKGDGTFEDRTREAGLAEQLGGLNCVQADYDNDGFLDVYIPRGAWFKSPVRPTLLRNNGDGTFADATAPAGLLDPVNSIAAQWADYDNDGWLDLFVCCERQPNRLYRNKGDGTFEECAARAGVAAAGGTWKGLAWIDYDGDRYPDLFLNDLRGTARLYHNAGDGTFTDATAALGIAGPEMGFSCWAFDYDNDGWLDLFATCYEHSVTDVVKGLLGESHGLGSNRLYRNLGGKKFQDTTKEAGLDLVFAAMGSNFADFDNDGLLDFYLGTGDPQLSMLVPNRLLRNLDGRRFADITGSSGTGHLQKGHGVGCGDWRRVGLVDLVVEMGGAVDGDRYHNVLFENPGQDNNWLNVKLVGRKTNRSALGARIKVVGAGPAGRTAYRWVSSGSSFGANPLEQHVGLGKAERVAVLEVYWPTSGTTQTFHDLPVNGYVEVTEFASDYRERKVEPVVVPERPR